MEDATDDAELLQRYVGRGSQEAFAALVRRHLPLVYSAAARQLGEERHLAQDASQEVFALLSRKAPGLVGHPALSGWLYTSTCYCVRQMRRGERRRQQRERKALTMAEQAEGQPREDWGAVRPALDAAMLELSERDRIAVLFRFFEGKSYAEIGRRLGLAENAARMRVNRALDALQGKLGKYGITSTAAALGVALSAEAVCAPPAALAGSIAASAGAAAAGSAGGFLLGSIALKFATGAALAAALAGLGWQYQANLRLREALAQETAAHAKALAAAQHEIARLQAQWDAARNGKKARPARPPADDRAQEESRIAENRRTIARRFAPLYDKLDLSDVVRGQLSQLLLDQHEAGVDFAAASAQTGQDLSRDPNIYWASVGALRASIQAQIKTLLGDDGYRQYLADDFVVRQNAVLEGIDKHLAPQNEALTPDQSSQLLAILQRRKTYRVSAGVIQEASRFLSPAQLEELTAFAQRETSGVQKDTVQTTIQDNLPADGAPSP